MSDTCEAVCWMDEYGRDAQCMLPPDHDGTHVDAYEGWEW